MLLYKVSTCHILSLSPARPDLESVQIHRFPTLCRDISRTGKISVEVKHYQEYKILWLRRAGVVRTASQHHKFCRCARHRDPDTKGTETITAEPEADLLHAAVLRCAQDFAGMEMDATLSLSTGSAECSHTLAEGHDGSITTLCLGMRWPQDVSMPSSTCQQLPHQPNYPPQHR